MSLTTLLLFAFATFLLTVSPGPGVLYVVARSLSQGRKAGFASMFGIESGEVMWLAATATGLPLGDFVLMHLFAAMLHFRQPDCVMDCPFWCLLHTHQGQSCRLAPRIEFEPALLQRALLHPSVAQPDHEGLDPVHHGPPTRQQESCPLGRTRHERLFLFVEYKNHLHSPFGASYEAV